MAIEGGEDAAAMAPEGRGDVEEVRDDGDDEGSGEGLGNALPAARVKRIMRKNPDKKKNFSKETVLAVSMATELFLDDMVKQSHAYTAAKRRKTMQLQDIEDAVRNVARYEFANGPGILPMVQDRKKADKAEGKEESKEPAATTMQQTKGEGASDKAPETPMQEESKDQNGAGKEQGVQEPLLVEEAPETIKSNEIIEKDQGGEASARSADQGAPVAMETE